MKPQYLTKSRFQLAMECPTKLYYCDKPEYSNLNETNSFLQALAEGGFQVAELAKAYHPEGKTISTLDYNEALKQTNDMLKMDEITIFEAAVLHENMFARIDILIKKNNHLTLIEVKSKSIDHEDKTPFFTSKGKKDIRSEWKPYVFDVAFQKYILSKCFPDFEISSYLMLVDKDSLCPSDGLNQKFRIAKKKTGKIKAICKDLTQVEIKNKILKKINVDDEINFIFYERKFEDGRNFSECLRYLIEQYQSDIKIPPNLGVICRKCEFKIDSNNSASTLKSGFNECWSSVCSMKENDPTILDVWDFRKADKLIKNGVYRVRQLNEDDINPISDNLPGLSKEQRRWKQVEKIIKNDTSCYLDTDNLTNEIGRLDYPLNFIDFETAMPAIPFRKNQKPCSGLAFQYSHHILHENGLVEHVNQFLHNKIGENPNLDFIRSLKKSLEDYPGHIFRYAAHENTYLNMIYSELVNSTDYISDRDDLINFIQHISQPTEKNEGKWEPGKRNMIDLCELVKRYYYDPLTKGSNSIKKIFPAILHRSAFLQDKYCKPIYGMDGEIKSLNFKNKQWIEWCDGKIINPYDSLPGLFEELNISEEKIDLLFHDDKLKEGGSASIAYARMQFTEMHDDERKELRRALLQYCELDTLAMVMIVEAWRNPHKIL